LYTQNCLTLSGRRVSIVGMNEELQALEAKSKQEIATLWITHVGGAPPKHVRKNQLIRLLAYRIQEKRGLGLAPFTVKRIRELAGRFENRNATMDKLQTVKSGTRFVRKWSGRTYHVTALEAGFEYSGKHFKSLSEVARLITGTRWSGPLFFGLKTFPGRGRSNAQGS
jgi:hypothetical protein